MTQAKLFDLDAGSDARQTAATFTSGNGRVFFVAFRDAGASMTPAAQGGQLVTFDDLDAARAGAGALGVAAPVRWARVADLCKRHGLGLPTNGNGGGGAR